MILDEILENGTSNVLGLKGIIMIDYPLSLLCCFHDVILLNSLEELYCILLIQSRHFGENLET